MYAPRAIGRHIRTAAQARASLVENKSIWMINIGTHKKPYDQAELDELSESLRRAIDAVFERDEWASQILYRVVMHGGAFIDQLLPAQRGNERLKVSHSTYEVVVETGAKQGRIDAHVMLEVTHGDSLLRFDQKNFANILQDELLIENSLFVANDTRSSDPVKAHLHLAWPEVGRPYVSFRTVLRSHQRPGALYMRKQFLADAQEVEAFKELAPIINDRNVAV